MNNDINVGMAAADRRSHRDGMQELLQRLMGVSLKVGGGGGGGHHTQGDESHGYRYSK